MLFIWLKKWVAAVLSLILCYVIFGDIGIVFGVGLAAIFIKYL